MHHLEPARAHCHQIEDQSVSSISSVFLVRLHFAFLTTLTVSIWVVGYCPRPSFSYAFTTSHTFSKATVVAVRASISTPVFSFAETVTVTSIPVGIREVSTVVLSIFNESHRVRSSGIRSA